jgi:hypothetical protein
MADQDKYVMLISSLPHHGPLFAAKQAPLSRIKLDQRLRMLTEDDAALLDEIENLLQWRNLPMERTDAQLITQAHALVARLGDGPVKDIVEARLVLRTLVAALRRRERGEPAPDRQDVWGYGPWVHLIARNWTDPTFRLEGIFPWLPQANQLLSDHDAVGLERLLLGTVWDQLGRTGDWHRFDFAAVVIYVLRWNIVERWTRYTGRAAAQRFQTLVEAGLRDSGSPLH